MKWTPDETADPRCDVDAEVRSGTHAVNPDVNTSAPPGVTFAAPRSRSVSPASASPRSLTPEVTKEYVPDLSEATTVAEEEARKDIYEDPGLWGWLDCLGAVLVNMICCKFKVRWRLT